MNKKLTKSLLLIAAIIMGWCLPQQAKAQTDVTSTYLVNADFETEPTGAPADGVVYDIPGWTEVPTAGAHSFHKLGSVLYESTTNVGTAPTNGSSVSDNNNALLGIKIHWCPNTDIYVEQKVSLPAGKYNLTWDSYVQQTQANSTSRCGYVVDGVEHYMALASGVNVWTNNTQVFTLIETKEVTLRFGYRKTTSVGGGDSPILYVDNIKLMYYGVDKTELQSLVDSAEALIAAEGNGVAELTAAITTAQEVIDNPSATVAEVLAAEITMKKAIFDYECANATAENPLDLTYMVNNAAITSTSGWVNGRTASGQQYSGAPDNTYLDTYNMSATNIYQDLVGLPNGVYQLKAAGRAIAAVTEASIYAIGAERVSASINAIGNSGGDLSNGWNWVVVDGIVVLDGKLTIGFSSTTTSGQWAGADDFRLYYHGFDGAAALESLNENISAIRNMDFSNVGDNAFQVLTEAKNALLSVIDQIEVEINGLTSLTEEELEGYVARLDAALATFNAVPLNTPDAMQAYNITLNSNNAYHNNPITWVAGGNPTSGGYGLTYGEALIDPADATQQFYFVTSTAADYYYLKLIDETATPSERYVCLGSVYGGNTSQIRVTDDIANAASLKVEYANGYYKLWNGGANLYIGSNDAGVFSTNNNSNFIFVPVVENNPTDLNQAANSSFNVIISNGVLSVSGVEAYQVYNVQGMQVAECAGNRSIELLQGVYFVKSNGMVQKVLVK